MDKKIKLTLASIIVLAITVLSAAYLNLTGFSIQSSSITEQTIEVEVWANSYIELETQKDKIITKVHLDNGTLFEQAETELNINNQKLNSLNKSLFNLSGTSPGTYILEIESQGSPTQYVNPASLKTQIEITESRRIIILEESNEKENRNKTNETPIQKTLNETTVNFDVGENCEEFEETIFWSSGFSNNRDSVTYEAWQPSYNCSDFSSSDCILGNLEIETRFLSFEEINTQGEGYVQISDKELATCENPEQGTYEKYLAYETLHGESQIKGKYCGNNKNPNANCGIELTDNFSGDSCYGIKLYADERFIVDAFEARYTLCSVQGGSK